MDRLLGAVPFWFWNGNMDAEEIKWQIEDYESKGIKGFVLHSRKGRKIGYLTEEWMDRVKLALEEARKRQMKVWIYDEDHYPSGYAGGIVSSRGKPYLQRFLKVNEITSEKNVPEDALGIFIIEGENYYPVNDIKAVKWERMGQEYRIAAMELEYFNQDNVSVDILNGYVDVLNPEVVDCFIQVTYDEYYRRFSEYFGSTIECFFTDEPNLRNDFTKTIPKVIWTENLPQLFRQYWGYNLLDYLPCLFFDVKGYTEVRYDFYRWISYRFVQSYTARIADWCEKHGVALTGHYLLEEPLRLQPMCNGFSMEHYRIMQVPGIDHLGKAIGMDNNFIQNVMIKQVASVANQTEKPFITSETFGAGGWDINYRNIKRTIDWQMSLNINIFNLHGSFYTLEGQTKKDHPPAFSYQQPLYGEFRSMSSYMERTLTYLKDFGPSSNVLMVHPMDSIWATQNPARQYWYYQDETGYPPEDDTVNWWFVKISQGLLENHIEYDYGSESMIEDMARVRDKSFELGEMTYGYVVVPPVTTLRRRVVDRLYSFKKQGGKVITVGEKPCMIEGRYYFDGEFKQKLDFLYTDSINYPVKESVMELIRQLDGSKSYSIESNVNILVNHKRRNNEHVFFVVNPSDNTACINMKIRLKGILWEYDSFTVKDAMLSAAKCDEGLQTAFMLNPLESRIIRLFEGKRIKFGDEKWEYNNVSHNVLPLDYVCCNEKGDNCNSLVPAVFLYEKQNMECQLKYSVEVEENPEGICWLAVEEQENIEVSINGRLLEPVFEGWYVDRYIRKISVKNCFSNGMNEIVIKRTENTNYENVYLLGDFGVFEKDGRLCIGKKPENLYLKTVPFQGFMFYAGEMVYDNTFLLLTIEGKYVLDIECPQYHGVIDINVNGIRADTITWGVKQVDITPFTREGKNALELKYTNTLRNLMGPHHKNNIETMNGIGPMDFNDKENWTHRYRVLEEDLSLDVSIINFK